MTLPLESIVPETDAPDIRPRGAEEKNDPANLTRFTPCWPSLGMPVGFSLIAATGANAVWRYPAWRRFRGAQAPLLRAMMADLAFHLPRRCRRLPQFIIDTPEHIGIEQHAAGGRFVFRQGRRQ